MPLSPGLAQRLWTMLATHDDDAVVFVDAFNVPVRRTHLYRVVRAAGTRAGIEWPVGLHTFRHSCASIMFRRGVPKEAIRKLLGHHSWDFTAGTYLHLDDDDLPDGAVVGDLTVPANLSTSPNPEERLERQTDAESELGAGSLFAPAAVRRAAS